jgi:uncharacterized protein (TIGR00369 family)
MSQASLSGDRQPHLPATGLNQVQRDILDKTPFVGFLGLTVSPSDRAFSCHMTFREEHIGNPLLRTFHGGIVASFGETSAALYLVHELDLDDEPQCSSMTVDYLRPAFAGQLRAQPRIVRSGKRLVVVFVEIFLDARLVATGRYIYSRQSPRSK